MDKYQLSTMDKYRGMRTRQQVWVGIINTIKEGMLLVGIVIGALLVYNTSVLSETIVREATVIEKLEETWLSCLNNGAVYIGGELHICKAANTGLGKKHLEDAK